MTLGPGADGNQPGKAFIFEPDWLGEGVSLVVVEVQAGAPGAQQSADLVSGSCAAPGETVYPLAAVVNGASFTILSATADEIVAQGLSVQVHQAGQTDRVNACGAVLAPAPPAPAPAPPHIDIKAPSTGTGPVARRRSSVVAAGRARSNGRASPSWRVWASGAISRAKFGLT